MSVPTISPRQLADLCKSGKIDLIDVRTPVEYRELHAAHALVEATLDSKLVTLGTHGDTRLADAAQAILLHAQDRVTPKASA